MFTVEYFVSGNLNGAPVQYYIVLFEKYNICDIVSDLINSRYSKMALALILPRSPLFYISIKLWAALKLKLHTSMQSKAALQHQRVSGG